MTKKIVIISNYYPPEMGAAANRIANMAQGFKDKNCQVTVLCPLPNYPKGKVFSNYKKKFRVKETIKGIEVIRHWIYPTISKNPILRFLGMISFSVSLWTSFFYLKKGKFDTLIVNTPPLFVGYSGLLLSKLLKIKNILNVSDLWPLSALELGVIKKGKLFSLLEKVEYKNYKLAEKIVGQSEEIITHIADKKLDKDFFIYRNVPFLKEYQPKNKNEKVKIVYAGLLGFAQGILSICKNINFKELGVEFHIYGAGMEEKEIRTYINECNDAIFFHGSVSAKEIKEKIRENDIALVPLYKTIKGAVPSKIFELIQLGVPILYIGDGEAATIINNNNVGLTSLPEDFKKLKENIHYFKNLSKKEFQEYSLRSIALHKEKYHLEYQLGNLHQFIN